MVMRQILLALTVLLLAACGSSDETAEADLPGDYAAIIESETECDQLQEIFDTADGAAEGMRERSEIDRAREFTAVMEAADERMREVGCYDN